MWKRFCGPVDFYGVSSAGTGAGYLLLYLPSAPVPPSDLTSHEALCLT